MQYTVQSLSLCDARCIINILRDRDTHQVKMGAHDPSLMALENAEAPTAHRYTGKYHMF